MDRPGHASLALMGAAILLVGCTAPVGPSSGPIAREQTGASPSQSRVLTIAARYEVTQLLPQIRSVGDPWPITRAFNAALTLNDDRGSVRPYLAEALPQLNTDTWRVFPDGRMETTYRLRPGLTWHDGQALSAEDFVFAWRVYTKRGLSVFTASTEALMETVDAADSRTLVIHWRSQYPNAASFPVGDFDPLPRHLLDEPFASLDQNPAGADAFLGLPYWQSEYIGAGPYKLAHWEPGSYFEGVAFDGHALGRPKIDRIIIRIIGDDTVALTSILAGTVDWTQLYFEGSRLLERDWVPAGNGTVIFTRGNISSMAIQLRPEYVGHPALLDDRVRRALAYSLDRQAIDDGVFEGRGFMTETLVPDTEPFYQEVDRAIMRYRYDPRRSEQLMNEAGFAKDRDGFFANATEERFGLDFRRDSVSDNGPLQLIQADAWKRAGFDVRLTSLPAVGTLSIGEQRNTIPGIQMRGGATERSWISAEIGTPENRWAGSNSAGWSNAEYDRLYDAFTTTLNPTERTRQFVQMQRLLSEDLPVFFMNFGFDARAYVSALRGPKGESRGAGTLTRTTLKNWNIHEWEWTR